MGRGALVTTALAMLACAGTPSAPKTGPPTPAGRPDTVGGPDPAAPAANPVGAIAAFEPVNDTCRLSRIEGERSVSIAVFQAPCSALRRFDLGPLGTHPLVAIDDATFRIDLGSGRVVELPDPARGPLTAVGWVGPEIRATGRADGDQAARYRLAGDQWVDAEIGDDPADWLPSAPWGAPTPVAPGPPLTDFADVFPADAGGWALIPDLEPIRVAAHHVAGSATTPLYGSDGTTWHPLAGADDLDRQPVTVTAVGPWLLVSGPAAGPVLVDLRTRRPSWRGATGGSAAWWPAAESPPEPHEPVTQCAAGERVIFSCGIGATDVASLCGAAAGLQYRLGPPGQPEVVFPAAFDATAFTYEHRSLGQTASDTVRFDRDGATTAIRVSHGPSPDFRFQGITVTKADAPIGWMPCSETPVTDWEAAAAGRSAERRRGDPLQRTAGEQSGVVARATDGVRQDNVKLVDGRPVEARRAAELDTDPTDWLDRQVTLVGIARDAAAGAIVLLSDGTPVFVLGLSGWDEGWDRKRIRITGTLRSRRIGGDAGVDERGAVRHGMDGDSLVLEGATWALHAPSGG